MNRLILLLALIPSLAFGQGAPIQRSYITTNPAPIADTNRFFVRIGGDNATATPGDQFRPYSTPAAALTAQRTLRLAGNTNYFELVFGVGAWNLGTNSMWPTNNVIISGAGSNLTFLYYTGEEHTNGPAIMWNPGVGIRNLYGRCLQPINWGGESTSNLDMTFVGTLNNSPNSNVLSTNFIENCMLIAGAHCLQVNPAVTTDWSLTRVINSTMIASNSPTHNVSTNSWIQLFNCDLFNYGPEPRGRDESFAAEVELGKFEAYNSRFHITDSGFANYVVYGVESSIESLGIAPPATNTWITLDDCIFDVTSTSGSAILLGDIYIGGANTAWPKYTISNCRRLDGTPLIIQNDSSSPITNTDILDTRFSTGLTAVTNNGVVTVTTNGAGTTGTNVVNALVQDNRVWTNTGGMFGTIITNLAASGIIGEYITSLVPTNGGVVVLATGVASNITSIAITPGDWDVFGVVSISNAVSTPYTHASVGGISTVSGTLPTDGTEVYSLIIATILSAEINSIALPPKRITTSSNLTVYLVGQATQTGGLGAVYGGGYIAARRVR